MVAEDCVQSSPGSYLAVKRCNGHCFILSGVSLCHLPLYGSSVRNNHGLYIVNFRPELSILYPSLICVFKGGDKLKAGYDVVDKGGIRSR